ncbi:MAG: hypothetical protein R2867_06890 [Caldilineaceae bacterium]
MVLLADVDTFAGCACPTSDAGASALIDPTFAFWARLRALFLPLASLHAATGNESITQTVRVMTWNSYFRNQNGAALLDAIEEIQTRYGGDPRVGGMAFKVRWPLNWLTAFPIKNVIQPMAHRAWPFSAATQLCHDAPTFRPMGELPN